MKLIIGLGNPGEEYANVRHNLGFMVLDKLRDKLQVTGDRWENNEKFKSQICNLKTTHPSFGGETYNLILAKPQTFMNNSGLAVKLLTTYYKLQPEDVIVVYDELDLPLGKIKVRKGGAAAGHHGVENIIKSLGTDQFIRVRLGIGTVKTQLSERKSGSTVAEKFVLEGFMHSERAPLKHMLKQAVHALEILLEEGLEKVQNQFN